MKFDKTYQNKSREDAKMMDQLLDTVINYATGKHKAMGMQSVDINEIVTSICDEIQDKKEYIGSNFQINEELPIIQGVSYSLIHQVFENIMNNAVKYNKSETPIINISWSENQQEYTFAISDNGVGISPNLSDKLFNFLDKSIETTANLGSGLGLALCKKIVERYQGRIWLESTPEQGSTFLFTIGKTDLQSKKNIGNTHILFGAHDQDQYQKNIA